MTATASASTPSSLGGRGSWRRPDIQGLRAIAVLSVIAFHADLPIPGGFTGVDIFFVISGYVITELILREHTHGRFGFARFYAKRAQRLLPALALMIIVVFIASLLFQSPFGAQATTAQTGIGAMLLIANIVITRTIGDYFAPTAEANPLLHTWSLSVEEQFYLIFPALLIFGLAWGMRRASNSRIAFHLVLALTLVSFIIGVSWSFGYSPFNLTSQPGAWAFYLSPARAWEFGVGALLALAVTRHNFTIPKSAALPVALLGSALLIAGFWAITPETAFPGLAALLPALGTVFLIAAGKQHNLISASLSTSPMVRIGDWSYSLYLWHWPLIVFALLLWPTAPSVAAIAAAVSFLPALLSYHFLEDPIRRRRLSLRFVAIASAVTSLAVIGLGLLLWIMGPSLIPGVGNLQQQRKAPTASMASECFLLGEYRAEQMDGCWFRTDGAKGWVLLAGDSHAAHAADAVIAAAHERNLDVFSLTGGVCPFELSPVGASDVPNCDEMNADIWALVTSANPPVLAVIGDKGTPAGTAEMLNAFAEQSIPVVWVRDVPRWAPLARGIQTLPCTGGIANFTCEFTRDQVLDFQSKNRDREEEILSNSPSTYPVDAWPIFCSGDTCSPIQGGVLTYVDNEHLNAYGSELLTPLVRDAFDRALSGDSPKAPSE